MLHNFSCSGKIYWLLIWFISCNTASLRSSSALFGLNSSFANAKGSLDLFTLSCFKTMSKSPVVHGRVLFSCASFSHLSHRFSLCNWCNCKPDLILGGSSLSLYVSIVSFSIVLLVVTKFPLESIIAVGGSATMPLNLRFRLHNFPTLTPPSLHASPSHAS